MRRWLAALVLAGIVPAISTSEQPGVPARLEARLYDLGWLEAGSSTAPGQFKQLSVEGVHFGLWPKGTPLYSPLYYDVWEYDLAQDLDRLEELAHDAVDRVPGNSKFEFQVADPGGVPHAWITATAEGHRQIAALLEPIRAYFEARIRVVVREDNRLIGAASGRIGEEISIARVAERAHSADSQRGSDQLDTIYLENFREGEELSCWGVKLADGRIRLHGRLYQRKLMSLRRVPTQGGTLELPEYEAEYQPFVFDVPDPGLAIVTTSGGRRLEMRVSCGTDLGDSIRQLPDGTILHYRNLLGLLRRRLGEDMLNKPWYDIAAGDWYSFWGGPSSVVAERIEDRILYDSDVVHHSWWGYGQAFSWNPRRFADEEQAVAQRSWDHLHQLLDEQVSATPGRFRVRIWRANESRSSDSAESLGTPVVTAELTLFEGQDASWCHILGTELVADYDSMVAVPVGIRGMSKHVCLRGDQVTVLWEHGQVSATYTHRSPAGPLAQFDTGLREPGPLVLETMPTRQLELQWLAPLGVGETVVAVSPAGDGQVLVGELHRVE